MGLIVIAIIAFLADYSLRLLVRCTNDFGQNSFETLGEAAWGRKGAYPIHFLAVCVYAQSSVWKIHAMVCLRKSRPFLCRSRFCAGYTACSIARVRAQRTSVSHCSFAFAFTCTVGLTLLVMLIQSTSSVPDNYC